MCKINTSYLNVVALEAAELCGGSEEEEKKEEEEKDYGQSHDTMGT